MLRVDDVHTYYGRSHVLQGVTLHVDAGEVVTLLGRNGVGKTTTLRSIVGLTPARRGRVSLLDRDITRSRTDAIARAGVAFVGSGRRTFSGLTVAQHLALVDRPRDRERRWTTDRVVEMFPKLESLWHRQAGFLSGGEQQMLKLSVALLANPRLLLLDEPTEGLAPAVVTELGGWITRLREDGLSILLCEQNAVFALRLADRGYLMDKGRIQHSGPAAELLGSAELRQHIGI
jgi:branched-chain amino acid transport system ATP-binding protein